MPSTDAAARQVRSMAAASSGRDGDATTSPGMSRSTADGVVVVEMAAEPFLVAVSCDPHDHRVAVLPVREELTVSRPRLEVDPRRCAGTPGTGSREPAAAPRRRAPSARPRIDCSSSSVSKTRGPPNRRCSPRVTPYTPPLRPTSSPNTQHFGSSRERVGERAVDRLGQGQRPRLFGHSRPRRRGRRISAAAARSRVGGHGCGRRGDDRRHHLASGRQASDG